MLYWWQRLRTHPNRVLIGGFAAVIFVGHILLALPVSASGRRVGELDWLGHHKICLLAVWQAGQKDAPSSPAPDRRIAENDLLILSGHIDQLRELRKLK